MTNNPSPNPRYGQRQRFATYLPEKDAAEIIALREKWQMSDSAVLSILIKKALHPDTWMSPDASASPK